MILCNSLDETKDYLHLQMLILVVIQIIED